MSPLRNKPSSNVLIGKRMRREDEAYTAENQETTNSRQ